MRLKSIKLAGFKSFVDPTTVEFPSNLSCIVGPNGCGKSNTIDAVRWVMGESSAKNLRGENMTDVIFNGSINRKPIGQASIELVFDNTDGTLQGEYGRFSEISIKRRVTREGQSDYFLNGTKCRRRDITDIFLGTGLGPRSYAIIEQGMISRLIESKPEELRVFIEEAAGISKYKERRRDTENRMRRTRENLERLTDLRDEMERQLQHLHRQAQAAERYTELKKEERLLKAQLQALQWHNYDSQVKDRETAIRELEVKLESVIADQRSLDNNIEKFRESFTEANDKFNEVQKRFYTIGSEISRAEQSIQHQKERSVQLQEDLRQTEESFVHAEQLLQADTEQQETWNIELLELAPALAMAQASDEEISTSLNQAEENMQGWQDDWNAFNANAAEPRQKAEVQQSRILHLEKVLTRLQERSEKLDEEKASLSAGPLEEELELLQEQLAEFDLQIEYQQNRLQEANEAIQKQRDLNRDYGNDLNQIRSQLQSKKGREASLEALQQAALGQQGGAVNQWLKANNLSGQQRLAETLNVESGWDKAVETVLSDYLQAVCIEQIDAVATIASQLEKGAVSFVDGGSVFAADTSKATTLASKVNSDTAKSLLAGVYVADDLVAALSFRKQLAANESVVTPDGLWLGANWLRVAKDNDAQAGVLSRKQELETLREEIADLEEQLSVKEEERETGREALSTFEELRDKLQQEQRDQSRKHGELRSQVSAKQVKLEEFTSRRNRINRDINDVKEQFQMEQETLGEARMILQEAIEAMEHDEGRREALNRQGEELRNTLEQARQSARQQQDNARQVQMRHQTIQTQLSAIAQNIARSSQQVEQLKSRKEQLLESLSGANEPIEELKLELESKLEQRLVVEQEMQESRTIADEAEQSLREAERGRSTIEQGAQTVRAELETKRVEVQGLQVHRRTLEEQLIETQFDLEQVLENLPESADEKIWQENLESIGRRIVRLGAINLAAIDEYKSQSERKTYLDAQNDDLESALQTLENAIQKIDKETRQRFKETFDTVNSSLKELFPKVFGGGTAYLEMTGDDLLDTGIAIMARPPGKRNSTIHLLSGGEKALTAIALVFSIFRLNPAPFCMLDEVDAPLDDANVGRYARLVQEMSKTVQFIYITHNKIAMEMAETLLGVTMHEPGVSRLVSVDVDEAAELASA